MLFRGPDIKSLCQKSKPFKGLSQPSAIFVGMFSEAPSATDPEPKELSPAAAGGEGFGRKTPALMINNMAPSDL